MRVGGGLDEGVTFLFRGFGCYSEFGGVRGGSGERVGLCPEPTGVIHAGEGNGFPVGGAGVVAECHAGHEKNETEDDDAVHRDEVWVIFAVPEGTGDVVVAGVYVFVGIRDAEVPDPY